MRIRISESKLHSIIRQAINETMGYDDECMTFDPLEDVLDKIGWGIEDIQLCTPPNGAWGETIYVARKSGNANPQELLDAARNVIGTDDFEIYLHKSNGRYWLFVTETERFDDTNDGTDNEPF